MDFDASEYINDNLLSKGSTLIGGGTGLKPAPIFKASSFWKNHQDKAAITSRIEEGCSIQNKHY